MKKLLLTLRDIIILLLLVVLSQAIAGIQIPSLASNHPLNIVKTDIVAPLIYGALFYGGFVWLRGRVFNNRFATISWPPRLYPRYLAYAFGLIFLITLGWLSVGIQVRYPRLDSYLFWQNAISLIFADTLTAPFVEEIAFRGVVLGQIAKRYNVKMGLLASSLLFGLVHLLNGRLNFFSACQLVIAGTLMGLLLGLIYLYEQSIWANYTVHAVYNFFWDLFPIQHSVTHDWPLQLIVHSHHQLLTGGQYGMDCSLVNTTAYALMCMIMIYLIKKAPRQSRWML